MTILILGLILFLGIHSVSIVSPAFRERQVAKGGEGRWKGIYSLVALAGLLLMIWGFGQARLTAPILYEPPAGLKHLNLVLMFFAFWALMVSQLPAGRVKALLKHPMLVAVKLWAIGHLLSNGDLASILLFGGFLVWAVLDRISVKRRAIPTPAPGPIAMDLVALGITIVVHLLFIWRLHEWLFGVSPVA